GHVDPAVGAEADRLAVSDGEQHPVGVTEQRSDASRSQKTPLIRLVVKKHRHLSVGPEARVESSIGLEAREREPIRAGWEDRASRDDRVVWLKDDGDRVRWSRGERRARDSRSPERRVERTVPVQASNGQLAIGELAPDRRGDQDLSIRLLRETLDRIEHGRVDDPTRPEARIDGTVASEPLEVPANVSAPHEEFAVVLQK